MSIKWFIEESRVHMAHLSEDEFRAKLPLAVMLWIVEMAKMKVERILSYVRRKIRPH